TRVVCAPRILRPRCTLFACTTLFRSQQYGGCNSGSRLPLVKCYKTAIIGEVCRKTIGLMRNSFPNNLNQDHIGVAPRFGAKELQDRKSTRLNSSHVKNSYAVFCLTKK